MLYQIYSTFRQPITSVLYGIDSDNQTFLKEVNSNVINEVIEQIGEHLRHC